MKNLKYVSVSKILIGTDVKIEEIPVELKNVKAEMVNDRNISSMMPKLLSEQENGYIVVITHQPKIAALISAVNANLDKHKISVVLNGTIDTTALEKEIKHSSLHTNDGKNYFPEPGLYKGLYHSGNSIIIKRKPNDGEKPVYTSDNKVFGIILDQQYRYNDIKGTVDRNLHEINIQEKARLFMELTKYKENNLSSFSNILLIADGNKHYFVSLPDNSASEKNVYESYLELFTSITFNSEIGEAVIELSKSALPNVIKEDINRILTNRFINDDIKLPSVKLLKNSMERIIIGG